MAKVNLNDITSGYNLSTAYNANNTILETALDNTLSRDGSTPNHMLANLDMNSYQITNLADATADSMAVTYRQLQNAVFSELQPSDAAVVATYAAVRAITTPANGEVALVTAPDQTGVFVFSSSETNTSDDGMFLQPTDGTTGAWVRRRGAGPINVKWFGAQGDGTTDDTLAVERALDFMANSGSEATTGILYFPSGNYEISSTIDLDRGNIIIMGEGRRTTRLRAAASMQSLLRHRRTDGNRSGGFSMMEIMIDGQDFTVDRALWIEQVNYCRLYNVEVQDVSGTGIYLSDAQDMYLHVHVHRCGRRYQATATATISAGARAVTLSAADDFLTNDVIVIEGAGASGADFEGIIQGDMREGDTTFNVHADCVDGATTATCHVGRPAVLIGDGKTLFTDPDVTGVCNAIWFEPGSTVERNKFHGLVAYRCDYLELNNCKFHGRTPIDEATPDPWINVWTARGKSHKVVGCQIEKVRRRALKFEQGGSRTLVPQVVGCVFGQPGNYVDATDIAFIELVDTTDSAIIDGNVFEDGLSHASYTSNGYDIINGTDVTGVNIHIGVPGNGFYSDSTKGKGTVSTSGKGHYYNGTFTPAPKFGGGSTGMALTTQKGFFTKNGNQCTVNIKLNWSNKGTDTGAFTIEDLPFVHTNDTSFPLPFVYPIQHQRSDTNDWQVACTSGSSTCTFKEESSATDKDDTDITTGRDYYFTFTYQVKD